MKLCQSTFSIFKLKYAILSLVFTSFYVVSADLDKRYYYFMDGKAVSGWGLTLGDSKNWVMSLSSTSADSADNQVTISPATYKKEGDAINLKWSRKKGKGQFALYGSPVDLTDVEHQVALTMEIKVIRKPKKTVSLGVDCGYPCRGELNIHSMLREFETDKWLTFPIPLDCITSRGADASKINAPFIIATEGRFEIELANIRLERLPDGTPTCKG